MVLIWCSEADYDGLEPAVLWEGTRDSSTARSELWSLPELVDSDRERWRRRFLEWLSPEPDSLGAPTGESRERWLRDNLDYGDILRASDNPFSDESLAYRVIRFWALCEVLALRKPEHVVLVAADSDLAAAVRRWCARQSWAPSVEMRNSGWRGRPRAIARWLDGAWATQCAKGATRWLEFLTLAILNGVSRVSYTPEPSSALVVSYRRGSRSEGLEDRRAYWGREFDQVLPAATEWLEIPTRSVRSGDRSRRGGEGATSTGHMATSIFDLMQLSMLPGMLRDWARVVSHSIGRPTQGRGPGVRANTLAEWPLLRRSVRQGTVGGASVDNMFWIAAFDRLLSSAPRLGPCFFLSEMQGWEVALMSSWFRLQTTPIVGVQHSTVAFWDMRYALGPKVLAHVRAGSREAQYRLAVNGPLAMRHLLDDGYAESELVETEALRYLDLRRVASLKNAASSPADPGRFGLLLCGEYDERATARLVNTVSAALSSLQLPPRVIFRPHPGSPVRVPAGKIDGQYEVVSADLSDLLGQAQLIVCGSVSSVAIDGLLSGRTVAVLRDPRCFPGPAASELQLINSAGELAEVILQADSQVTSGGSEGLDPSAWFCLDSSMSRWRGLVQWALGRAS